MIRVDLGYWYIKVQIEAHYGAREQNHKDGKGGIFEIGHLHFHTTELDAPSDG